MEYELLDTGIFDEDRYFDVVVEYAKAAPDDILMLVTAHNRGPDTATLHLLPTLWFRNTWSWDDEVTRPTLTAADGARGSADVRASHPELGEWLLQADASAQLLFCENETNNQRLFGVPNESPHVKDGVNDFVVNGVAEAVNPEQAGTKVAAHHVLEVPAGGQRLDSRALDRVGPLEGGSAGQGKAAGRGLRPRVQSPTQGGRQVLRDGHPSGLALGRGDRDAPGAGRVVVGQAVLRVQRASVAARARSRPVGPERSCQRRAQRAVVPHDRGRHHLDAGQVGVSVVRGVGSRLSLCAAVAGRRRFRQAAGRAVAGHPLCAPQRSDPGVRVELQRRQPTGDRLGGALRVRARGRDPGRGGPRVPRASVRPVADELHLVGQPQGSR